MSGEIEEKSRACRAEKVTAFFSGLLGVIVGKSKEGSIAVAEQFFHVEGRCAGLRGACMQRTGAKARRNRRYESYRGPVSADAKRKVRGGGWRGSRAQKREGMRPFSEEI